MDPDGTDEGETRRDEADDLETALGMLRPTARRRCPRRGRAHLGHISPGGAKPEGQVREDDHYAVDAWRCRSVATSCGSGFTIRVVRIQGQFSWYCSAFYISSIKESARCRTTRSPIVAARSPLSSILNIDLELVSVSGESGPLAAALSVERTVSSDARPSKCQLSLSPRRKNSFLSTRSKKMKESELTSPPPPPRSAHGSTTPAHTGSQQQDESRSRSCGKVRPGPLWTSRRS